MTSMFARLKKKLTRREKSPATEPLSAGGPQNSQAQPLGADDVENIRQEFLVAKLEAIKSATPRPTSTGRPATNASPRTTLVHEQTEVFPPPQRASTGLDLAEKILAAGNSGTASPALSHRQEIASSSPLTASLAIAPVDPNRQAPADAVPVPVLRDILTEIVGHDIAHQRRRIARQRRNGKGN